MQRLLISEARRRNLLRRSEAGLNALLTLIDELQDEIKNAPVGKSPQLQNIETENLLTVARLMAYAALQRKESRGAHFRVDYQQKNDAKFGRPVIIEKGKDGICATYLAQ